MDPSAPAWSGPWLTGPLEPVADERDVADLRVTGRLPDGLSGRLLRNGPNAAFAPLGRYHLFDGDGMVHGLWLDGEGGARYANRWVESAGLAAERAAGHSLFGGLLDFRLPSPEVIAEVGLLKNTANTHVVAHAGRILALMEACKPTELGPDLETLGEVDFDGALHGPMTAHPKVDPVTGEMVFFGYGPFPPYMRVHSVDAEGRLTWTTEVDLLGPVMMHDFVVTETRVVIFDLPAVFDVEALMAGGDAVRWDPDRGARIGILERGAPGSSTTWVDVDPFWVFHFLNAHDDGDAIVVHGCRTDRLNAGLGEGDDGAEPPRFHRWRIDPVAGTMTDERLWDRGGDFPRIDDRRAGLEARVGYLARGGERAPDDELATFDAIERHDLVTGVVTVAEHGAGVIAGEPVFAPDPASDEPDAGWVLAWTYDVASGDSEVVVREATTLEVEARVHLPRRVPFGFHGSWVPDA